MLGESWEAILPCQTKLQLCHKPYVPIVTSSIDMSALCPCMVLALVILFNCHNLSIDNNGLRIVQDIITVYWGPSPTNLLRFKLQEWSTVTRLQLQNTEHKQQSCTWCLFHSYNWRLPANFWTQIWPPKPPRAMNNTSDWQSVGLGICCKCQLDSEK